jgi:glycosyltransferase involved in cell wall biosynthesis
VPDETLVVAYAADPRRLHRHRVEVRRRAHVGVAADPSLLDQLGLLLPQALLAADGPTLRSTLEAVANDRLFFERTRGAAARDRQRPTRIRRERPRILLQVDRFIQGGLEQVVLDLAEVLLAEGLDPRLLILGRASQAADSARQLGLPIVSLPVDDRPAAYRELLARERISLVNAHYSLFGAALAAEAGVPFVQTVHNTYCWLSPKELELEREAARHTTLYACVSQSVALYSARILGLPTERLRVVPNGVEVARHGPLSARARQEARAALGLGPEDVVILNVATLSETKAQLPLVLAFAEVAAAHPRAKLLSVGRTGDESYAERIRDVIERQGLADRVLLVGHRDDAPTLYGASDLFCLPSYWEGDSLAMAEAALSGLHLVATDVGSARELIAEVGGTLVDAPFGSVIDLEADTQRRWLDDPEALCRLLAPRLAAALTAPTPPVVTEVHRHRLDRRQAYRAYASLFASLLPA